MAERGAEVVEDEFWVVVGGAAVAGDSLAFDPVRHAEVERGAAG